MSEAVIPGIDAADGVVRGVKDPAVRRRRRTQQLIYAGRIALLVVVLGSWQYFGPRMGEIVASSPQHVFDSLRSLAVSGTLRAVQVAVAAVQSLETGCAVRP